MIPSESPAVFDDVLPRPAAATYLYQGSSRAWCATQPTVAKLAEDRAAQLKRDPDQVAAEITCVGGGAWIDLRRRAVKRGVHGSGPRYHVTVSPAPQMPILPSSSRRLAIALGGIAPKSDRPETRMKEPTSFRGILR